MMPGVVRMSETNRSQLNIPVFQFCKDHAQEKTQATTREGAIE